MRTIVLATTVCVTALAQPARAQQAAPAVDESATIVVTGQRAQQQRAIDLKREALGVIDVAAADEIGQLPDRNVAEVVERLPGVGVQYDQGEGRYVSVRGIPSALNQYTINGFEIGNPDGNTRRLPLDVISGQLLNRVEVSKVKTPDQDGQGIGGLINLVTQTAFDFRETFVVQATAQVGAQELNYKTPVRGDVSVGGRFGADRAFGVLLGASYSDRTFRSFGFFPDDWVPIAGASRGGLPINIKFTDYELKRERIGATGSLDWRPGGDHQLYLRGIYSRFTEAEYRQRYRLDFANGGQRLIDGGQLILNPDGLTGTSTRTEIRQDLRLEYKEKSVLAGMAGGSSRIDLWTFDYGLSRVHNEVIEPNQVWQFRNVTPVGPVDFDFTEKLFSALPRTPVAATNLQFRQYTAQDENGEEDIWALRFDARRELGLGSNSFVKVGVKYRTTDKSFDDANEVYDRGTSANRFTLAQAGAAGAPTDVLVRDDRVYVIPVTIDRDALAAFTQGRLGTLQFVRNNARSQANDTLSDLDIDEDVLAGYAMANLDWDSVALTAGLRIERTDLKIAGFQLQNGGTVIPAREDNSYTNWLPSLIARIKPAPGVVARIAYHRSLGRPEYSSLSPGGRITIEADEAVVALGNPRLKPFVSDNLDASAEYYFGRGGLVTAGAFAKFIKDPIFPSTFVVEDATFNGANYDRVEFSQPLNGRSARVYGLELAAQQQFTGLPGLLSGFGINLNLTLVSSRLRIPTDDGGSRTIDFAEQSKLLYGAQLFYQKGRVEASIAYHHTGRALLAAGDEEIEDQYNDDLRRLDAKASFALNRRISVFVEAQNLTDEPTRQYQGGRRDWVIQEERYGRTYWAGASIRL